MNYVNVVTARIQKEQAIRKLKELVSEFGKLSSQTRNLETHDQLDRQILRLNMYIAQLEVELDNGKDIFDKELFNDTYKQVFVIKRKIKRSIQQEDELKRMKIPASFIVLIVLTALASAITAGIIY